MDPYIMIILTYLASMGIVINGQETSEKCGSVEASCVSQVYDTTIDILVERLNNVEESLQKANDKIEKLEKQLNNTIENQSVKPSDCADLYKSGQTTSGVYTVYPNDMNNIQHKFQVYCDMTTDGGGWTVFQKRFDGSVPFNRYWNEYRDGFGNSNGEFWLGNKYVSMMTHSTQTNYSLRVDLKAFNGSTKYAQYTNFKLEPESAKFRLNIGTYNGTAGDGGKGLSYHRDMYFSSIERNNARSPASCTVYGGFWFKSCYYVNTNGVYKPADFTGADGIRWYAWLGIQTLQATSMKFRPMDFP